MRTLITKPMRKAIAIELARAVARVFAIQVPAIAYDQDGDGRSDRIHVMTSAGLLGITVECCPRGLSIFAQFEGEMDDAKRAAARLVDGNAWSGKVNWHCFPAEKPSAKWISDAVAFAELHLIKVRGTAHRPRKLNMRSTACLQQRRIAIGCERMAERESLRGLPWSDHTVRSFQRVMCQALAERNQLIRAYLDERKARS